MTGRPKPPWKLWSQVKLIWIIWQAHGPKLMPRYENRWDCKFQGYSELWCVVFFFLKVLLRCWECSWHMVLHGFKVNSMMIWHTYITECLSQQVYWTSIISYRCRVKEIESKMFSPVLRMLRICSLNFHVYYTAVFITFITSHITCLVLLITRSLCFWLPSSHFRFLHAQPEVTTHLIAFSMCVFVCFWSRMMRVVNLLR